ncbi:hypothetical protein HIM_03941 [Hirsutella minnesotensis 3608]|uniref:Uncharacterized protein n=1 Tax=Hirsutella minnesotensis 3608 TaxID=1043627 RepID=A0A0F7ZQ44_9HYPO|nr:hypothetical protein HIM_03941 [Hirsutella minnesotensis 3608]
MCEKARRYVCGHVQKRRTTCFYQPRNQGPVQALLDLLPCRRKTGCDRFTSEVRLMDKPCPACARSRWLPSAKPAARRKEYPVRALRNDQETSPLIERAKTNRSLEGQAPARGGQPRTKSGSPARSQTSPRGGPTAHHQQKGANTVNGRKLQRTDTKNNVSPRSNGSRK